MNEKILSYIWKFQLFNIHDLKTDFGENLIVLKTGTLNTNSGPDFTNARILINHIQWFGSIEIHVKASDWNKHKHSSDSNYESVILHVVWENDMTIYQTDGSILPTLCLNGLVKKSVLDQYFGLQGAHTSIPCKMHFQEIEQIQKLSMLDRMLLERLDNKASQIISLNQTNTNDWEESTFQWLGQHLGFKLNEAAFLKLTQLVPWNIVRKQQSVLQIEALLFGTAGLIPEESVNSQNDLYTTNLRAEYRYLVNKYNLSASQMIQNEWKFMRLRPAGFPTIRLAQFAQLLFRQFSLFSSLTSFKTRIEIEVFFNLEQSEYWQTHFQFGKPSKSIAPKMGNQAAHLLAINVCIPLMVAVAKERNQPQLMENAFDLLLEIPAEKNKITREWEELGMKVVSASDSQALLQWYNHYCTFKRCLECTVGVAIISMD